MTVGLYYLPPNESQTSRHRALKESAHGTKDIFGYPIGAQLLSNESEYEIPSNKLFYQRQAHQFKYFREMTGQTHMDARFGKPEYTRLSDVERGNILRGLLATWYVYSFRTIDYAIFSSFDTNLKDKISKGNNFEKIKSQKKILEKNSL